MIIDDDWINNLPDIPEEGAKQICSLIKSYHRDRAGAINYFEGYVELYSFLSTYLEAHNLPYILPEMSMEAVATDTIYQTVCAITIDLDKKSTLNKVDVLKSKFQAKLKIAFAYEFSEGDLKRVQQLINELRTLITECSDFEDNHKSRLLKRLEKLQAELHKRISDVDKFWGLIGDAGVVIGKFGDDAKPFVDRIREISDIVWRTQARAEELPSSTPTPLITSADDIN